MKLQHPSDTALLIVGLAMLLCLEMSLCCIDSQSRHRSMVPFRGNGNARIFMFPNGKNDPIPVPMQPYISLKGVPYNQSYKTVFIIPGLASKVLGKWPEEMGKVIAEKENYNVFAVDWSSTLESVDLLASVYKIWNKHGVAQEISRLILYLTKEHDLSLDDIHLIGHDLGAHIAAYVSNLCGTVGQITGLDAGLPLSKRYYKQYKNVILDSSDACFVEAIQATTKSTRFGLGISNEATGVGDVNFYINTGADQLGCSILYMLKRSESLFDILTRASMFLLGSSYKLSTTLYMEALRNTNCMWGYQDSLNSSYISSLIDDDATPYPTVDNCNLTSCTPLGLDTVTFPGRGRFHLHTKEKSPYCIPNPEVDKKMALIIGDRVPALEIKKSCKDKGIR